MSEVYIVDGARTAFGKFGGSFTNVSATELGTATAVEAMKRSKVVPEQINHVIFGNVIHTQKSAPYLSRHIGLYSGIPQEVPALTLNRLCGSGMQSVVCAAQHILVGDAILYWLVAQKTCHKHHFPILRKDLAQKWGIYHPRICF
ncbi:acetyl-CoA acetyltransferase [Schinkia azotoformans MEV2011]|uniref:acetyl-CoA C-acetyltransferase n=1 Tax=Schinkia azotoformans MEV2011 TaxID=1348973 RepID=A0A072NHR1_SCHAZ|nr:acetyl-CoA acetyltransferase [Schinkia azotoformans MEV2011]